MLSKHFSLHYTSALNRLNDWVYQNNKAILWLENIMGSFPQSDAL